MYHSQFDDVNKNHSRSTLCSEEGRGEREKGWTENVSMDQFDD